MTAMIVDGTESTRKPAKAEVVAMTTPTLASRQSTVSIQLVSNSTRINTV